MQSITDILQDRQPSKQSSERNSVMKEIYELYQKDRLSRKLENWKRYVKWLKNNRIKEDESAQKAFKKSKLYIKELPPKTIAIKLAHIKTPDLYYLLSICRDKANRRESVGAYLLGSIKPKLDNSNTPVS